MVYDSVQWRAYSLSYSDLTNLIQTNMQPNKKDGSKYILTRDTYDRLRVGVDVKPTVVDQTNGNIYRATYRYVTAEGKEKIEYIRGIAPTLSFPYGCGKRDPKEGEQAKETDKYGLTLGDRVVAEINPPRKPKAHEDDEGKLVKWEEFPRAFHIQADSTGNAFRNDARVLSPAHAQAILDFYWLICDIQAVLREKVAFILSNEERPRTLIYDSKNDLIRSSSKTTYQDVHAKVAQFPNKDTKVMEVALRATTDYEGKNVVKFDEFCAKSGGARGAAWWTIPSIHVSSSALVSVRMTIDRVLLKALGVDPKSSRESNSVNPDMIPDDEAIDPSLAGLGVPAPEEENEEEEPPAKRAKPSSVPHDEDASLEENESGVEQSVFS